MIEQEFATYKLILEPVLREELLVGKKYCSPIPRANNHYESLPSFSVFEGGEGYTGYLFWKDWGITEKIGARPVDLLMRLHNVDKERAKEMLETLEMPEVVEYKRQKKYKLQIEDRPKLNEKEIDWWGRYGVTQDTLEFFDVWGVDRCLAGESVLYSKENNGVAYSYRGGPDLEFAQFYSPDPKKFWRIGMFIFGWNQLPYIGDDLIILSGGKDCMACYEGTGIPVLSGSGEGCWKQFQPHMPVLRRRFKRIWSLHDPDHPGIMATRTFKEQLDVPPAGFIYPDLRDIADLCRDEGVEIIGQEILKAISR